MSKTKTPQPTPDVGFGVEIECALPRQSAGYGKITAALAAVGIGTYTGDGARYASWSMSGDGGTCDPNYSAIEIRTRILQGEAGLEELKRGMDALKAMGGKGGIYCGMHVHVSRAGLNEDQLKLWRAAFIRYALCFDQIVSPYRYFAGYGSGSLVGEAYVRDKRVVKREKAATLRWGRYSTFAIRDNIETVEIRQHHGTVNSQRACEWVRLMLALRQRAINPHFGGDRMLLGDTDASFRWALMSLGLAKSSRDYWLAERQAFRTTVNEDMPLADIPYVEQQRKNFLAGHPSLAQQKAVA